MSGYLLNVIKCPDTRRMMRAALDGGWEWVGYTKSGHVEILWPATGALLHCATTPSDRNSWKQFARNVEQASGLCLRAKVNHRRSRKSSSDADVELAASRRRHARQVQATKAAQIRQQQQAEARALAAERSAADDRRRRDIESLMRNGGGR